MIRSHPINKYELCDILEHEKMVRKSFRGDCREATLFQTDMEWGTPGPERSRGEQRRGEASPVHNCLK